MAVKCPDCKEDLKCRLSIRTDEEGRPVELSYQWWGCLACGKKYYAKFEDNHGNMFDDRLEHIGYYAEEEAWQKTLAWCLRCPDQSNTACNCAAHKAMPPSDFHGASAWYTYD